MSNELDAHAQTIPSQNGKNLKRKTEEERGILAFPNVDGFYSGLADRIWMSLERYFLTEKFIILITALPRNHEEGTMKYYPRFAEGYPFVFVGIDEIRGMVDEAFHVNEEPEDVSKAWDVLFNTRLKKMESHVVQNGQISSKYYTALVNRTMKLDTIEEFGMGSLIDYFKPLYSPDLDKKQTIGDFQKEEDVIMTYYLKDYRQYHFISLPLIQFAEFDGAVHIIYHEDDRPVFVDKSGKMKRRVVENVIKTFSFVYEEYILNWDFPNAKDYKEKVLEALLNEARDPDLYKGLQENALLYDLKFREYYDKYQEYFKDRIIYTTNIPHDARELYRRIAIMNILIDSYTHNISAHSLVALESWFKQRAYYLDNNGEIDENNITIPDIDFIKNERQHFAHELHEMIRFMLEKGAFWTGLNRDVNYGGKTSSLFDVIYNDFISNPLYLGTIAYSEGVTRLNVHITILKKLENRGSYIQWLKEVKTDGLLATVDLKTWKENGTSKKRGDDHHYKSGFVEHGTHFKEIKEQLEQYKAFFPGGVVGKHALLTILENEIRNIKHHPPEAIEEMKKTGLNLNISLEAGHYDLHDLNTGKKPEYLLMGVWLGHKQLIGKETFQERLEKMWGDIVDEHNNPRLGGVQQDKICAAFLFNNAFSKVQPPFNLSERDRRFYPWMKLGFCSLDQLPKGTKFVEWEISSRRVLGKAKATEIWPEGKVENRADMEEARRALSAKEFNEAWPEERITNVIELEASREMYAQRFQGGEGAYKKLFHLWCGEDIFTYDYREGGDKEWENMARFRFIYLPSATDEKQHLDAFRSLRQNGSIRILDEPAESLQAAYNQWFRKWIKSPEKASFDQFGIRLMIKKQSIAQVYWDGHSTEFVSKGWKPAAQWPSITNRINIKLTHGRQSHSRAESDESRYRNHGVLMDYFCKGYEKPEAARMEPLLAAEFLETMATKICIFDKRLVKWFEKWHSDKMDALGCEVYQEDYVKWREIRDRGFFRYHFVVVHLSFIEGMIDPKTGQKYTESTIDKFIENEILQGQKAPDNFFLVIASGRGRKQWQYTLTVTAREKAYYTFVVYRPLESLHSAAENSQMKLDDLETKYMLTKILIGS